MPKKAVVFMFEVHQPLRLRRDFTAHLINTVARKGRVDAGDLYNLYFDDYENRRILERVASRCYIPANRIILERIDQHRYDAKKFKVAYSISGILIEQCEKWRPDVIESFRQLADTKMVEFLDQTYYHSLASVFSDREFEDQLLEHRGKMRDLLGVEPAVAENTEFIYNNRVASTLERMGYRAVFTEGAEKILGWRSPNYVYKAKNAEIRLLLRNYRLSDDIGFRFAARGWEEYPLTADKYAAWLASTPGQVINICIDYETFGEHFPPETGILEFLSWLPGEILKWENLTTMTPSEVVDSYEPVGEIDVPVESTVSWADMERDLSAWLMNPMQVSSFDSIVQLEKPLRLIGDDELLRVWRLLMISDHLYYMSTKGGGSGEVHTYFSPYGSAHEAYACFTKAVSDLFVRVMERFRDESMRLRLMWGRNVLHPFEFYLDWGKPLGWTARNMDELTWCIEHAPVESIEHHFFGGHFADWIEKEVGDRQLAEELDGLGEIRGEGLRRRILELIYRRRELIFGR